MIYDGDGMVLSNLGDCTIVFGQVDCPVFSGLGNCTVVCVLGHVHLYLVWSRNPI